MAKAEKTKDPRWVKPMLAKSWDEEKHKGLWTDAEWVCCEKMDGIRLLVSGDKCWSRSGLEKDVPFLKGVIPEDTVVDGELMCIEYGKESGDVGHWMANDQTKLKYVIFDIIQYKGIDIKNRGFIDRKVILGDLIRSRAVKDRIELEQCSTYDEKKILRDKIEGLGGEGVIFKKVNEKYKPGSRTVFIKYKFTFDVDVIIVDAEGYPSEWRRKPGEIKDGVSYPDGLHTDPWLKGYRNLRYGWKCAETGEVKIVGTLGETGPQEELIEKYVGKVVKVKCWGLYPSGAARHPVMKEVRSDEKSVDECVFDFSTGKIVEVENG